MSSDLRKYGYVITCVEDQGAGMSWYTLGDKR